MKRTWISIGNIAFYTIVLVFLVTACSIIPKITWLTQNQNASFAEPFSSDSEVLENSPSKLFYSTSAQNGEQSVSIMFLLDKSGSVIGEVQNTNDTKLLHCSPTASNNLYNPKHLRFLAKLFGLLTELPIDDDQIYIGMAGFGSKYEEIIPIDTIDTLKSSERIWAEYLLNNKLQIDYYTNYRAALTNASNALQKADQNKAIPSRKIILILSDGYFDTDNRSAQDDIEEELKKLSDGAIEVYLLPVCPNDNKDEYLNFWKHEANLVISKDQTEDVVNVWARKIIEILDLENKLNGRWIDDTTSPEKLDIKVPGDIYEINFGFTGFSPEASLSIQNRKIVSGVSLVMDNLKPNPGCSDKIFHVKYERGGGFVWWRSFSTPPPKISLSISPFEYGTDVLVNDQELILTTYLKFENFPSGEIKDWAGCYRQPLYYYRYENNPIDPSVIPCSNVGGPSVWCSDVIGDRIFSQAKWKPNDELSPGLKVEIQSIVDCKDDTKLESPLQSTPILFRSQILRPKLTYREYRRGYGENILVFSFESAFEFNGISDVPRIYLLSDLDRETIIDKPRSNDLDCLSAKNIFKPNPSAMNIQKQEIERLRNLLPNFASFYEIKRTPDVIPQNPAGYRATNTGVLWSTGYEIEIFDYQFKTCEYKSILIDWMGVSGKSIDSSWICSIGINLNDVECVHRSYSP